MGSRTVPVRSTAATLGALAVAGSLLAGVAGCGDRYASYCDAVSSAQQDLGEALAAGPAQGLLTALPLLAGLQAKAPSDVRGDWDQVVGAVHGLQVALQSAGVDPATYDVAHPPASLTGAAKARIAAAATALGSPATVASWGRLQQQVRDVCHTQLFVGA